MGLGIRSSKMKSALFVFGRFYYVRPVARCYSACFQMVTKPEEIARLYRDLSLFPSLTRADLGPVVTSQYGGKYTNIYTGKLILVFLQMWIFFWLWLPFYWHLCCRMDPMWPGEKWECQVLQTVYCFPWWQVSSFLWSLRKLYRD